MRIQITILVLIFFISCSEVDKNTLENFAEFNEHFHSDSLFQINRIVFPLKGKSINGFEKKDWSKPKWEQLKVAVGKKIEDKNYKQKVVLSDSIVTEKIWIENTGFSFVRKFENRKGKWFLVYLNDVNL